MASAGTPVIPSAYSRVNDSTWALNSLYPDVECSTNLVFVRPAWMISRARALARAISDPVSIPSQTSAHSADSLRRGSTVYIFAPLRIPLARWWKKMGCVLRALEPHRMMRSVVSISSYADVPPPAPSTAARPATEGACQVRLQLSTLLVWNTVRANF